MEQEIMSLDIAAEGKWLFCVDCDFMHLVKPTHSKDNHGIEGWKQDFISFPWMGNITGIETDLRNF